MRVQAPHLLIIDSSLDTEQARSATSMTLVQAVGAKFSWTSTDDVVLARPQLLVL